MGFHERYTEEEREALASAYTDRGIRPARRVVELAAAGELEHNGERLPAFEANESTVRGLASGLGRRRAGQLTSQLSTAAPRDAVEALRRRLVNLADARLGEMERHARKSKGHVEWEQIRQAGGVDPAEALTGL